jgi:hypothetical protein
MLDHLSWHRVNRCLTNLYLKPGLGHYSYSFPSGDIDARLVFPRNYSRDFSPMSNVGVIAGIFYYRARCLTAVKGTSVDLKIDLFGTGEFNLNLVDYLLLQQRNRSRPGSRGSTGSGSVT